LGVAPLVGAVGAGVWLVVFAVFRFASVSSMAAGASLPLASWLLGYPWPVIAFAGAAALAIVALHRANIRRLAAGTESRVALRRRSVSPAG
jgi:glycerol-3-phosphate acyltransferase PlsY